MVLDTKNLTYLQQVRLYRRFAEAALTNYSLSCKKLDFIHHGENSTFRVHTNKKSYLLRIHRHGYHTTAAIKEEMKWLNSLKSSGKLGTQEPILNNKSQWVSHVPLEGFSTRQCTVLEWIPGLYRFKSLSPHYFFQTGQLLAELHKSTQRKRSCEQRKYWTPEGLLGPQASMGPLRQLEREFGKDYQTVEAARKLVLKKIRSYQKRCPDRLGLIHADLHFGNVIWSQTGPSPIDFDDSGWGFHAYDLAVPLEWMRRAFKDSHKKHAQDMATQLVAGYESKMPWSRKEEEILPWFMAARKLVMIGWTGNRMDHPDIWKHFKKSKKQSLLHLQKLLNEGPPPLTGY